ncbi:addiction module antidote protein [Limnohabitans sp.]
MNAPRDVSFDDYMVEPMKDPTQAAAYIESVIELDDSAALLEALRHVAKAHGMAELGDKSLFKALNENGNPKLDTVNKVLQAVGLRLSVAPAVPGI